MHPHLIVAPLELKFAGPPDAGTFEGYGAVFGNVDLHGDRILPGALAYAAQIFDREDASVLISTEDRDNFVKNMVTILAEERLALVVRRPQALIKGTFVAQSSK